MCFPGDTCIRSSDDSSDFKNTNLRRTIKTNRGDFFSRNTFFDKVRIFPYLIKYREEENLFFVWYHIFISGQTCLTTNDSPDSNAECKFPWKFNGKLLNECTDQTDPDGK